MILPSSHCGPTTETVGWFRCDSEQLGSWLVEGLGEEWSRRFERFASIDEVCRFLVPGSQHGANVLIPCDGWTAVLTDGPLGTDLGMLPSLAARELRCLATRATVAEEGSGSYGAAIFEVFDPSATSDPLRCRRNIYAANDGGTWRFGAYGQAFEFEDVERYRRRRIRDRFTPAMVVDYLEELGAPVSGRLDLARATIVERRQRSAG